MNNERFAYEEAERRIDAYCYDEARTRGFRRTYRKLKLVMSVIAYTDYAPDAKLTEAAIACAWEELQLALTGRGEDVISGPIIQLWKHTPLGERDELRAVFVEAFNKAEAATGPDVRRLYTHKYRRQHYWLLDDEEPDDDSLDDAGTIAPYFGARLEELALDQGHDVEDLLAWHEDEELADRVVHHHAFRRKKSPPKLSVLPGGAT